MQQISTSPVHIGLWGPFDVERLDAALTLRVTLRELARRLPQARLHAAAPFGYLNPGTFDGAEPVEPLGAWSEERAAELGERLDAVVVAGDAIRFRFDDLVPCYAEDPGELRPDRFFIEALPECPVAFSAAGVPFDLSADHAVRVKEALTGDLVSVRDEESRRRLEEAGVEGEIPVVPNPAVLADRLFDPEVLDKRLRYLRHMGWYPPGPALVVEVSRAVDPGSLARAVEVSARERPHLEVVAVPTEPCGGDEAPVNAFLDALRIPVRPLPPRSSLEDLAAAAANAETFVSATEAGTYLALGFGRPVVPAGEGPANVPADALPGLREAADRHFDRLAEILAAAAPAQREESPERRIAELEERLRLLERAHDARGRRLVADAARFADLRREAELLRGSRTFRYTAWLRRLFGGRR